MGQRAGLATGRELALLRAEWAVDRQTALVEPLRKRPPHLGTDSLDEPVFLATLGGDHALRPEVPPNVGTDSIARERRFGDFRAMRANCRVPTSAIGSAASVVNNNFERRISRVFIIAGRMSREPSYVNTLCANFVQHAFANSPIFELEAQNISAVMNRSRFLSQPKLDFGRLKFISPDFMRVSRTLELRTTRLSFRSSSPTCQRNGDAGEGAACEALPCPHLWRSFLLGPMQRREHGGRPVR